LANAPAQPRVAVAHDWLLQYAGSERVVEQLLAAFPDSPLLTALIRPEAVPEQLRRAEPSWLQRVPGALDHHEWLLPLIPLAWRTRAPLDGVDVVVSSSHSCAKAVRVAVGIPHVCYCHTPMRYAWDFSLEAGRVPAPLRPAASVAMGWFRRWDAKTARSVTTFVANSTAVRRRIRTSYGRDAEVIFPPVRTGFYTPGPEQRGGDFLYVGRLVAYKRPDLVVEAFAGLSERLVVAGDGPMGAKLRERATPNVTFLGAVDDATLLRLYRTSRALVYPAEEDFGIVMAEAQACGLPVIGLDRGGAPDIVEHERTGWLLAEQTVDELRRTVRRAATEELDGAGIAAGSARFSEERFRSELQRVVREVVAA
jgi:glycosyltransferase involved in cell wall biosynthesis